MFSAAHSETLTPPGHSETPVKPSVKNRTLEPFLSREASVTNIKAELTRETRRKVHLTHLMKYTAPSWVKSISQPLGKSMRKQNHKITLFSFLAPQARSAFRGMGVGRTRKIHRSANSVRTNHFTFFCPLFLPVYVSSKY